MCNAVKDKVKQYKLTMASDDVEEDLYRVSFKDCVFSMGGNTEDKTHRRSMFLLIHIVCLSHESFHIWGDETSEI